MRARGTDPLAHPIAHPARQLLRRQGAGMRYTEINLFGVYVAPIAPMIVAAWVLLIPLRRFADRFGLLRYVWHPALFLFAILPDSAVGDRASGRQGRRLMADADVQMKTPSARAPARAAGRRQRHADEPAARRAGAGDADRARVGRHRRLGDVAGLHGCALDARRHGARLCRHHHAGGLRQHRATPGRRQPVRPQGRPADGDRPDRLRDRRRTGASRRRPGGCQCRERPAGGASGARS